METEITKIEGYTIVYEPRDKTFYLRDSYGETVGQGKTQDEVEEQAKKLAKRGFKPVAALRRSNLELELGRVTSINLADQSVRFAFDEKRKSAWGYESRGAIKFGLRYGSGGLYELTDQNQSIKEQVDGLLVEHKRIEEQIQDLMKQLEKPINLEYFNLK